MKPFRASVTYNEETIKRMGKVQSNSRFIHNAVYLIVCLALILVGVYYSATTKLGITCIAFGGIGIPLLGSMTKYRTDNVIKALGGKTLLVNYKFEKEEIFLTTKGQTNRIKYTDLTKLWEDNDYFYIFYGKYDTLMVPKKSLVPNNPDSFRDELSKVTGLSWYINSSIPLFNLKAFVNNAKRAVQRRTRM